MSETGAELFGYQILVIILWMFLWLAAVMWSLSKEP